MDTYSANPKDRPVYECLDYPGQLIADNIYLTWTNKNWENVDRDDPGVVGADWDIWGEVTPGTLQIINGGHVSFIDINAPTPEPLDPK
ncbi:hypothetical protein [Boudabousia tangfeifanii]|nr:hypothetical protein [Boudabousia tangfeifanii]